MPSQNSVQIRVSTKNHRALTILASSWGMTTMGAANRIIETYILGDQIVQTLLKTANEAAKTGGGLQ